MAEPQPTPSIFQTQKVKLSSKNFTSLAIDPTGRWAALSGRGITFVDLDEPSKHPRNVRDPKQSGKDYSLVKWSISPTLLATSCLQSLTLWDHSTERHSVLSTFQCHRRAISYFDWSHHDNGLLATCSMDSDSYLYLWDVRNSKAAVKNSGFRSHAGGATSVKWNKKREHLIASAHGTQVLIWDVRRETAPIAIITADSAPIIDLDWCPTDPSQIMSCSHNKVKFWSVDKPRQVMSVLPSTVPISRAKYTPFGTGVVGVTTAENHAFDIYQISRIHSAEMIHSSLSESAAVHRVAWRTAVIAGQPEYQLVSYSATDDSLRLWPIDAEHEKLCGHNPSQSCIKFTEMRRQQQQHQPNGDDSATTSTTSTPTSSASPSPGTSPTESTLLGLGRRRSTSTSTVARQVTLDQEWLALKKTPVDGIAIEKTNRVDRSMIVTAKWGPSMVQLRITFPTLYPNMAPPSFHLMSNISPHSTVKTKEAVVETAQDFVDRNLNCLDACFRKLMEVLKKETEFAKGIVAMEPLDRHYMLNTPVRRAPSSGLASPVSPLASAPDQHLPPGCTTYMVRPTDSLTGIALSFKMTVGELRNLNNIHHSAQLLPGQIIIVKQSVEEALRSPRSPRYRKPSIGATGYHSPLHHAPSEPLKPGMEAPNPATRTAALRNQVLKKKISFSRDDLHMAPSIRDTSPRDKTPSPNHSPSSSPSVNNLNKFMGQHTITRRTKQATLQGSHKDLHAVHLRCQYVDMLPAQPAFINGLLTMTDTQIIFEPDLDDAMVLIKGLRHYTIFVQMSSIVHAEPLQTTDLSLQRSMDSTYLQVLTSEKQPVSTSNMLLFMSTEQKVQEWSKLMMEWLSQQKEKTLMESLNLDSFMLKMPSRSNFTLGSPNRHGSMGQSGDLISSSRSASRFSDVSFGGGTSSRVPAPIPPFERSGSSSFGAPSIAPKPSEAVPVQPLPVQPEKIIKPSTSYDDDDLPRLLDVSRIITDKHVHAFYKNLPNRYRHCDWRLLFCTAVHGTSLITFFSKLKSEAPTLIIIKDSDGYVFGGFASESWEIRRGYFGTGECFLFTMEPQLAVYNWTQADDYFMFARRDCIAMGGQGSSGRNGFWLDSEFNYGTSEVCKTFLNRRLSNAEEFKCTVVEVWSFKL